MRRLIPSLVLLAAAGIAATPIEELAARMTPEARRKLGKLDPRGDEIARTFLTPLRPAPAALTAAERDRLRAQCADLLRNRVSLLHGYPAQDLGFPYDWFRAPKDDWQWPTHLSRHYYLLPLAQAYAATGEARCADRVVAVLAEWVRSFPLGRAGLPWRWKTAPGSAQPLSGEATFANYADGPWTSLSAHARTDTWLRLLPLVAGSASLDNETAALLLNSLLGDHRRVMIDFPRTGTANQFVAIGASLVNLSFALPDFEGAEEAKRVGLERVADFARRQVYEDGSVAECSPNYGLGSVARVNALAGEFAARGLAVPPVIAERVRKAVRYYAFISDPNLRSPRIAKGGGDVSRQLLDLNRTVKDPEVAWVVSRGREGTRPAALNFGFDWAGHFVFRTGWSPDDAWLFFEPGPRGSGHHDRAQLGVQLIAFAAPLLVDPGYYTYSSAGEEGRMYRHLSSTHAHNTAIVDGEGQISGPPGAPRGPNTAPGAYRWDGTSAEGAYTDGYGDRGQIRVVHRRRVSIAKGSPVFTIEDRFSGEGRHHHEILWQAPPKAEVRIEGNRVVIRTARATATLEFQSASPLSLTSVPGWFSETYGDLQPATTIKVAIEDTSPAVRTGVTVSRN